MVVDMSDPCRPPPGTKAGTVHVLRSSIGDPFYLEWNGIDAWRMSGGPWVTAARICDLGGYYVAPAETRDA